MNHRNNWFVLAPALISIPILFLFWQVLDNGQANDIRSINQTVTSLSGLVEALTVQVTNLTFSSDASVGQHLSTLGSQYAAQQVCVKVLLVISINHVVSGVFDFGP